MKDNELRFLVGMLLEKLGGEVTITAEDQMKFSDGLVHKELLMNEDPSTRALTFKIATKDQIKD